jgi:hypothetical protein
MDVFQTTERIFVVIQSTTLLISFNFSNSLKLRAQVMRQMYCQITLPDTRTQFSPRDLPGNGKNN